MRYFRTEDNTGFKYIHSKDDKVIYIENETAEAPQFSLQYGDKLIQIFVTNDEYRPERDIVGTPDLFTLSYRSDMNDKGQYILATEAEINIYEDDFFNIDELKTVGETDILIKYFEYDELVWQGFALPDFFQTGIAKPRVLRIVATDRIGVLKDIENTSVSNTPKEIIEECLLQTGLTLAVEIRSIDNYLTSTTIERERIEGVSAYDIIRAFMVQFNSKIVQYKNKWWIVNKKLLEDGFSDQEVIDIDLVYLDGQREIKPTASEVSLFLEFGGAKRYPKNWNFDNWTSNLLNNWTSYNGFVQNKNSKVPISYDSNYSLIYGQDTNINSLLSRNGFFSQVTDPNYINAPHIRSDEVSMQFIEGVSELNFEIDFTSINDDRLALYMVLLIRIPNSDTGYDDYIAVGEDGRVVKAGTTNIDLTKVPVMRVQPAADENQDMLTAIRTNVERNFKISVSEDLGLTSGANAKIQVILFGTEYNDGTITSLIDIILHSTKISFNDFETKGKGLIFKTKQGGDKFSKVRETETTLFSDKINQGVNGYFYNYKYDDTSITNLPKEYLLAMTQQMADMFCSARDFYSLGGKFKVNPLARYKCGNKYFVFVGGASHRENSEIDIEEIVSNPNLTRTDYIYTYFEDSKDNIKSIGTASGGGGSGGSGGGGGMTSSQLEQLTNLSDWWKLDEEGNLYTEKNMYSQQGVSALGLGEGGSGGGGGDFDRLDKWVDYDSSKAGWVISAFLGKDLDTRVGANSSSILDLNTRVDDLQSGSATNIEISGSGNAVTGVSKDGNTLTFAKGSTFSLSTHNHNTIYKPIGYVPSWSEITGKPTTFSPSAHTHIIGDVTELQGALDDKASLSQLDDKEDKFTKNSAFNKSFGTELNDVARGNHTHAFESLTSIPTTLAGYGITDAVNKSLTLTAGNGLTGGGTLEANRTLTLGTPSTLTNATTNEVTATSHTHAITTTSVGAANTIIQTNASGGTHLSNLRIEDWDLLTEASGARFTIKHEGATKMSISTVGSGVVDFYSDLFIQDNLTAGSIFSEDDVTAYELIAYETVATPQISFGNGFTIEPSGTELVFKYQNVIKQRMLSDGTILATGGISALSTE